jgi:hypothetical protein
LCVNGTGRCNSFQLNNPLRRVNIANGSLMQMKQGLPWMQTTSM